MKEKGLADIPKFPPSRYYLQLAGNLHCLKHFRTRHPQAAGLPIVVCEFEMVGMRVVRDDFLKFPEQKCCAIANASPETRQQPAVRHVYQPGVGCVLDVYVEALRWL